MIKVAIAFVILLAVPRIAAADERQIRGVLEFREYGESGTGFIGHLPVRWATVKIKRGSTVLGTAMTGHDGYFSRWIDTSQLPAGQTLTVELTAENYAAHVYLDMDASNDWITWGLQLPITTGTAAIDFSHSFTKPQGAVHLSILDSITYGRQWADLRRDDTDDISQVDVEYPQDTDSTYYTMTWEEITVQGPPLPPYPYGGGTIDEGWRDLSLLHEFGHHLEHRISELEDNGTDHFACDLPGHNYTQAWKEGFPTYYASSVASSYPQAIQGVPAIETLPEPCPPQSEQVLEALLWDIHDPANEAHDIIDGAQVVGGKDLRRIVFEIFDHEQENDVFGTYIPTTILTFHDAWVGRNLYTNAHSALDKLMFGFGLEPHGKADLRAQSVSAPASVNRGSPLSITTAVTRSGYLYAASEGVRLRYYLASFASGVFELAQVARAPFPLTPFNTTITVPASLPPGGYALFVEVDPGDRVTELNENNNLTFTSIVVN